LLLLRLECFSLLDSDWILDEENEGVMDKVEDDEGDEEDVKSILEAWLLSDC